MGPPASDGIDSQTGPNENTMDRGELMARHLEKAPHGMDTDQNSLNVELVSSNPVVEGLVSRSEVRDMMKNALNQMIN